ncbi:IS982 family transposase [Patescibacteria group bacterium]|jgi:transposase|nr:IS982 family transposase [Patescibacteria group bacterium]
MSLLEMFYDVDTFCVTMVKTGEMKQITQKKCGPHAQLCISEIITIMMHFHQSHYRDFKAYYTDYVCQQLRPEFPGLVSYTRFVELMPTALGTMTLYLCSRLGHTRGIAFIDSTPLPVCHNKRIFHHKVFDGLAARGKNSMGYFWGFKLHLVVNDQGELLSFLLSPGNVDDRKPVPSLVKHLWGKLFGDKGYISQPLFEQLFAQNLQLITFPKKKKKPETRLMPLFDKLLARKRSIIETINDQLKNISQIVHTRHRSPSNFLLNLLSGLLAYTFQEKKPALHFEQADLKLLPALI